MKQLSRLLIAIAATASIGAQADFTPTPMGFQDTETGLQWAKLDFLRGVCFNDLSTYIPRGFRLASPADVSLLFAHAGIEGPPGQSQTPEGVTDLLQAWGALSCCHSGMGSTFWVSTGEAGMLSFVVNRDTGLPAAWFAQSAGIDYDPSFQSPYLSAAIVSAVPETATVLLAIVGLGTLGWLVGVRP